MQFSFLNLVQGKENLDANGDSPNFIYKTIACVPLKGDYYEAGCNAVRQEMVLFTTGQTL